MGTNLKMLNKIEDHFILIDKCAGQTRIAEIKYRKLVKYISWFDNNPPKIGNICEATIIKKLNGGVARAKTKDQTVFSVRGVPQNIKPHSKVNIIITSEEFDDKPVQAKILSQDLANITGLNDIQRIIKLYFNEKLPIVEDNHAIYWDLLDLDNIFLSALKPKIEMIEGGVLWIEKTKAATLIDVDTTNLQLNSDEANLDFCKKVFIKCVEEIKLRNIGGMIIIDFPRVSFQSRKNLNEYILKIGKEYFSDGSFLGFSRLQLYELYIPRKFAPLESFYKDDKDFEFRNHIRSLWRKSKEIKAKNDVHFICGKTLYKKIVNEKLPPFIQIIERLDVPEEYGELMEMSK